jgi:hypothetical protein
VKPQQLPDFGQWRLTRTADFDNRPNAFFFKLY